MFTLDAWLENPDPSLRIIDEPSRRIVAEWRGQELRDLLETGIIAPADCCGPQARDQAHETIRELILEACLEGITVQRRPPEPRPDMSASMKRPADSDDHPTRNPHPGGASCEPATARSRSRRMTCAQGPGATQPTKKTRDIAKGQVLHVAFRKCPSLH
ncbi:hypothetical protein [Thioalkalivibrio sp. ALE31]|uniref:hypothetical protein n=1 Tax=Thioalkalivibrio sp. ALE31 TaxID=1158182 RepID=UPI00036B88F7|nr:hypothetical protein [Thioalkalivibrio sp. ALE31]